MVPDSELTLGIDATNLRAGGGRTHLIELLHHAQPLCHGFEKVVVWADNSLLAALPDSKWLLKRNPSALESDLIPRWLWQYYSLPNQVCIEGCHLLLVPGGAFGRHSHSYPIITMSRNMLPFEWRELQRYGFSIKALRLVSLRWLQSTSFRSADGVIFLTNYAAQNVQKITGPLSGLLQIIPHGVNSSFYRPPKPQQAIYEYTRACPYRLIYVSVIDPYKHQWHVVEAVSALRRTTNWSLTLDLVGPAYPPALRHLRRTIATHDPDEEWITYRGSVPYTELPRLYQQANLGIFASSCENMPNILLETMAAGLPVAASNYGPMPEILGHAGVYFNPTSSVEIATGLKCLIINPGLRATLAEKSYAKAQQYSWQTCAEQTFAFLNEVYHIKLGLNQKSKKPCSL